MLSLRSRPTAHKKNLPFTMLALSDDAPALMEMGSEGHVVFVPANVTSFAARGSMSYFDFQVLLFKKYSLEGYHCYK